MKTCLKVSNFMPSFNFTYVLFTRLFLGLFGSLTCIIGTFGIILLLVDLKRHAHCVDRMRMHLIALIVWDILHLVSAFMAHCLPPLIYSDIPLYGPYAHGLRIFSWLGRFAYIGTIWQIVAISGERYMAICHPLGHLRCRGRVSVKVICVLIGLMAALLTFPDEFARFEWTECFSNETGKYHWQLDKLENNTEEYLLYIFISDIIFRCPTPLVFITVMTVCTLYKIRVRHGPRTSRVANVTLSLLCIKFLIFNFPLLITSAFDFFMFNQAANSTRNDLQRIYLKKLGTISWYLSDVSNVMLTVNSATNWLLFYTFGGYLLRYRLTFSRAAMSAQSRQFAMFEGNSRRLFTLWKNIDPHRIALALLDAVFETNENLKNKDFRGMPLNEYKVELAHKIADFLDQIVTDSSAQPFSFDAFQHIQDQLRTVGRRHYELGIILKTGDWFVIREVLIDQLIPQRQSRLLLRRKSDHAEDITVVQTFVSVLIQEIKNGYMCSMVNDTVFRPITRSFHHSESSPYLRKLTLDYKHDKTIGKGSGCLKKFHANYSTFSHSTQYLDKDFEERSGFLKFKRIVSQVNV